MKKILLLSLLASIAAPAFAAQYSIKGTNVNLYRYAAPRTQQRTSSDIMNAFWTGTSLASGRLYLNSTPSLRTLPSTFLDPYIVTINNKNYILIKDSKDNKWSTENILGYEDSKENLFASLKNLETDGDNSKISVDELRKADIRFAHLNSDGSVALNERNLDYSLDNVLYIDMKNLRTALGNKNQDGTFGYFYVIIQDGNKKRPVAGRVTFEEKEELNKYIK